MEDLAQAGKPMTQRMSGGAPGDVYLAPGEWRGDAELLRPEVSKVVVAKVRRFRVKMVIYGGVIAIIMAWLVLSFTVWGNPSPGERSMQLIDAVNARDEEAFLNLFQEQSRPAAKDIYDRAVSYLGSTGSYDDVKLDVEKNENYDAISYIDSSIIQTGGGSSRNVSRSDNLLIVMENHKGRWYVVPKGTDIVP
jgi:hypothetical protein